MAFSNLVGFSKLDIFLIRKFLMMSSAPDLYLFKNPFKSGFKCSSIILLINIDNICKQFPQFNFFSTFFFQLFYFLFYFILFFFYIFLGVFFNSFFIEPSLVVTRSSRFPFLQ